MSRLQEATKGVRHTPPRLLVHGTAGVGKSTLASQAPSPIFLTGDHGADGLDVTRLEVQSWADLLAIVGELSEGDHAHRTLVVDTVNWMEPLCWAHVCAANKWKTIEEPGYGKGYIPVVDAWRAFIAGVERCWRRGMGVILLAHSDKKLFKNPEGEDFERYVVTMHDKSAALLSQWCDAVLFARHELAVHKDASKRVRGVGSGARFLHTEWRPAYDAKNRYRLPPVMPLDWTELAARIQGTVGDTPASIRERIAAVVNESGDEQLALKVAGYIRDAGESVARLVQIENAVQAKLQERAA